MINLQRAIEDRPGEYSAIAHHRVRERAYEIYERRGRKGGHADSDWFTAEAEFKELR